MKRPEFKLGLDDSTEATPDNQATENSRRRLLKSGAALVPVVLTLKSAPVLACNCKLPSGFSVSGNFSQTHSNVCSDPANGPNYWRANVSDKQKKFVFKNKFASGPESNDQTLTFGQILAGGGTLLEQQFVAAWLDGISSRFPGSQATVQAMWNDGVRGFGYTATPGVIWHRQEVVDYMTYVMRA